LARPSRADVGAFFARRAHGVVAMQAARRTIGDAFSWPLSFLRHLAMDLNTTAILPPVSWPANTL